MNLVDVFNLCNSDLSRIVVLDYMGNIITDDYFTKSSIDMGKRKVIEYHLTEYICIVIVE